METALPEDVYKPNLKDFFKYILMNSLDPILWFHHTLGHDQNKSASPLPKHDNILI